MFGVRGAVRKREEGKKNDGDGCGKGGRERERERERERNVVRCEGAGEYIFGVGRVKERKGFV